VKKRSFIIFFLVLIIVLGSMAFLLFSGVFKTRVHQFISWIHRVPIQAYVSGVFESPVASSTAVFSDSDDAHAVLLSRLSSTTKINTLSTSTLPVTMKEKPTLITPPPSVHHESSNPETTVTPTPIISPGFGGGIPVATSSDTSTDQDRGDDASSTEPIVLPGSTFTATTSTTTLFSTSSATVQCED
jgi:hypothetical protein